MKITKHGLEKTAGFIGAGIATVTLYALAPKLSDAPLDGLPESKPPAQIAKEMDEIKEQLSKAAFEDTVLLTVDSHNDLELNSKGATEVSTSTIHSIFGNELDIMTRRPVKLEFSKLRCDDKDSEPDNAGVVIVDLTIHPDGSAHSEVDWKPMYDVIYGDQQEFLTRPAEERTIDINFGVPCDPNMDSRSFDVINQVPIAHHNYPVTD